jgi:hypothetical protein
MKIEDSRLNICGILSIFFRLLHEKLITTKYNGQISELFASLTIGKMEYWAIGVPSG